MEEFVVIQVKLKLRESRKSVIRNQTNLFPLLDMDGIGKKTSFDYKSGEFFKLLYILFHYCIAGAI